MSKLQSAVIHQYKQKFPKDKLRHISEKTQIQITRVFRILNGSEMKLSEYESFKNCLQENSDFLEVSENIKELLSYSKPQAIQTLNLQILHKLAVHKLKTIQKSQVSQLNLVEA